MARKKNQFADDLPPQLAPIDARDGLVPSNQRRPVLEVKGLEVAYGGKPAVMQICCHFLGESVTAIMGPSGCGKSTLLKSLNRSIELTEGATITSGSVTFLKQNIYDPTVDPRIIKKRIGIIQQRPIIFPMSILENVLFGAKFYKTFQGIPAREYGEYCLDRVGLIEEVRDRLDEPGSGLSGGQQQRLCLARTLANKPEVILMDEPCSAIDPVATGRIEELIAELKTAYTIIVVTHNIAQANRISDQAILMVGGKIIEAGSNESLFQSPRTEIAHNFLSGQFG